MNILEIKSKLYTFDTDDNLYFVTTIFIDGKTMTDFHYYATSLNELKQSIASSGRYFILTCWCGIPECVGIDKGVQVIHYQNTVKWIVSQPQPHRILIFDAYNYKRAITFGIEQIKQDVCTLKFTATGEYDKKLQIVTGTEEDMALLELQD